jgi:hypothetical protein
MKNYNFKRGIAPLIIILVIAVAAIGGGTYAVKTNPGLVKKITGQGNATSTNAQASSTAALKTYTDAYLKISFKYPANWKVEKNLRTTVAGITAQSGVIITPANFNSKTVAYTQGIFIGGPQISCLSLAQSNPEVKCKTVGSLPDYPVYTSSKDVETLKVYDIVVGSIANITPSSTTQTKNQSENWAGIYTFNEFAQGIGSNQTLVYKLTLSKEGNRYLALIDINGWQTLTSIKAYATESNGKLSVVFDSYREGNEGGIFKKGDHLFTLEFANQNKLNVQWGKLKPVMANTSVSGSFFTKSN